LMSKEAWTRVYADAWARFYTDEHVETIMRRAVVTGVSKKKIRDDLTVFSGAARIDGVHPLQFGLVRRKIRTQRRHGMPIVNPLIFYPWRAYDTTKRMAAWLRLIWRYRRIQARVEADPTKLAYTDDALTPTAPGSEDHLVQIFADKIPKTHGAPVRAIAAAK
jgi:hypothetical protein